MKRLLLLLLFISTVTFVLKSQTDGGDKPVSATPAYGISYPPSDSMFIMSEEYLGIRWQPMWKHISEVRRLLGVGSGGSSLWTQTGNDIYFENNIGVGNTSPLFMIDAGDGISRLFRYRTDASSYLYFGQSSSERFGLQPSEADIIFNTGTPLALGTFDGQPLILGTNNNEALRIDVSGNVGLGTNTPSALLHTVGGDLIFDSGSGGFKSYRFLFNNSEIGGITTKSSKFGFYGGTTPTEHLVIESDGDIGVNNGNANSKVDILDGGDYQLNIRRSAALVTRFRCTPEGILLISNSNDNGVTYQNHFLIGLGDVIASANTDIDGAIEHANAIITLNDSSDDSDRSNYRLLSTQELNGFIVHIECENTVDFVDDGCSISTQSGKNIGDATTYDFNTEKTITLKYSATGNKWKFLNQ